ncbi:MAG TPA: hypothetical protein VN969_47405 [Streptosporangiaceae bacterium]|jgi:hypothetical protein|nr:hypothetical protein [Streptosporangiaceae bacterium]
MDGGTLQGWHPDPFGVHERRHFSAGRPTKLVRDGAAECYDEPPRDEWPAAEVPAASSFQGPAPVNVLAESMLLSAIAYLSRGGVIGLAAAVVRIIFANRPGSVIAYSVLFCIGTGMVLLGTVRAAQGRRARRAFQLDC